MNNYIKQAQATSSTVKHIHDIADRLSKPEIIARLAFLAGQFISLTELIDDLKKHLFYGKTIPPLDVRVEGKDHVTVETKLRNPKVIRLLHGIMGKATESGELMKQLFEHIYEDQPLDEVNIIEELGDDFWYAAEICAVLECTFDQIQDLNIRKLQQRYGQKFSEESALNRNLVNEREILEGMSDDEIIQAAKTERLKKLKPGEVSGPCPSCKREMLKKLSTGAIQCQACTYLFHVPTEGQMESLPSRKEERLQKLKQAYRNTE